MWIDAARVHYKGPVVVARICWRSEALTCDIELEVNRVAVGTIRGESALGVPHLASAIEQHRGAARAVLGIHDLRVASTVK